jgi:hypothetical protein
LFAQGSRFVRQLAAHLVERVKDAEVRFDVLKPKRDSLAEKPSQQIKKAEVIIPILSVLSLILDRLRANGFLQCFI